jgi:hypothetical protein
MKRMILCIGVFLLLAGSAAAQQSRLPVFFLRYEGSVGFEELNPEEVEEEDEEMLATESYRHKITLRIKEQVNNDLTANLYSAVSWKIYEDQSDDYTYFYLNPDCVWDITDRLRWRSEFRSKWTRYDRPDSEGESKDLTSLLVKTELAFKVLDQLKIVPSFRSAFDLYRNEAKLQQTYTAGLSFESRINPEVRFSGRYWGIYRAPLGAESEVRSRLNNEFGLNLSWDPNR